MSQTSWTQWHGCRSGAAPAISPHEDGRLYAVAVATTGDVRFSRAKKDADGWEAWKSIGGSAPLAAAPASAPRLVRSRDHRLLAFCRGADDNVHVTWRVGQQAWSGWRRVTTDSSCRGTVDVAITDGPMRVHLLYSGPGNTVHYRRFRPDWSPDGAPSQWPDASEGSIASDGDHEVVVALRQTRDNLALWRLQTPWTRGWSRPLTTHGRVPDRPCLGLSNTVHVGDAFHVAYVTRTLRDDIGGGYAYFLAHTRVLTGRADDQYFRVVREYTPTGGRHPQATLAGHRNLLYAVYADERGAVRCSWQDAADPETPWIGGSSVASGRSSVAPSLASFNARAYLQPAEQMRANFGNDLFAATRGASADSLWLINLSRTVAVDHMARIGHVVDWCARYSGPRTMGYCPTVVGLPAVSELPAQSEVGYGCMTLPHWLMSTVFTRIMAFEGQPNAPYHTWMHTTAMPNAYIGPGINIDYRMGDGPWQHEAMHRFATNIALYDDGAGHPNPNLMTDLFPVAVVTQAAALFGDRTNASQTCRAGTADGGRCRGFTGAGGNYDVGSRQHSLVELIRYYTNDGDGLRDFVYADLRAGDDLLRRKYDWVRRYIFRGVEFSTGNAVLHPVSIINRHSGKALDVPGWNMANNVELQQYDGHGGDNQRWALRADGGGYVHIQAMHSGLCLDVVGSSADDGAKVQQYARHGGPNQQWMLVPDDHGAFEIVARHSGKCLEVVGWSTANGGSIAQYDRHGGDNQKWVLQDG
jgi:hypothetical protein